MKITSGKQISSFGVYWTTHNVGTGCFASPVVVQWQGSSVCPSVYQSHLFVHMSGRDFRFSVTLFTPVTRTELHCGVTRLLHSFQLVGYLLLQTRGSLAEAVFATGTGNTRFPIRWVYEKFYRANFLAQTTLHINSLTLRGSGISNAI